MLSVTIQFVSFIAHFLFFSHTVILMRVSEMSIVVVTVTSTFYMAELKLKNNFLEHFTIMFESGYENQYEPL